MKADQPLNVVSVRSLFISDVHLGCRHARAEALLDFLARFETDRLYLVGDFIDGWKLCRKWRWTPVYNRIFRHLIDLSKSGVRLFYTPGNHDDFLRQFFEHFGVIEVADQFIHETPQGRRFLVTHGDHFDWFEKRARWLSQLSSRFYDALLSLNFAYNWLRRRTDAPYGVCRLLKQNVKSLVRHFSEFERLLVASARAHECQGVICGHIHQPKIAHLEDIAYCNTGDWVENCSALIEHHDGTLEIVNFDGAVSERLAPPTTPAATNPRPRRTRHDEIGDELLV